MTEGALGLGFGGALFALSLERGHYCFSLADVSEAAGKTNPQEILRPNENIKLRVFLADDGMQIGRLPFLPAAQTRGVWLNLSRKFRV